jgi:hypothetical protein
LRFAMAVRREDHLRVATIMNKLLMPGSYAVHLLFADPDASAAAPRGIKSPISR